MKRFTKIILSLVIFLSFYSAEAQNIFSSERLFQESTSRKGRMYMYWGYNRAGYTNSSIHLRGDNYNFTIEKATAQDNPTDFSWEVYFKPASLSIPQYNFGIGYYITNKYAVSLNVDHMKYIMTQDQFANINGVINEPNNPYNGVYNNKNQKITEDFLTFEHTDGLNYLNIEGSVTQDIYSSKSGNFAIETQVGLGLGALMPKSNVKLFNYPRNDAFHLAGFGVSSRLSLNFVIYKKLFLQANLKGGYINMPDIVTRNKSISDRADQRFVFLQENFLIGFSFPIKK